MPDPSLSSDPVAATTVVSCPQCGRAAAPDDRFCEVDGTPLGPDPAAVTTPRPPAPVVTGPGPVAGGGVTPAAPPGLCGCGGGGDPDGFCERCGMRLEAATTVLSSAPELGAATHVGKTHDTDEDAVAIGRVERDGVVTHALVVCDGVSSSSHGELASAAAARAALDVLLTAATTGAYDGPAVLRDAARTAHRAACTAGIAAVEGKDPPGTTFVAALQTGDRIDVSWVGDSRAYLIGPEPVALTHDHSWANQVVDSGEMTEDEAMHARYAHALLHCIGPLEEPDGDTPPEPSVGHVVVSAPGCQLVLCSDGLWNYASAPAAVAALVAESADADASVVAARLVQRGLDLGGHDDVSVAVLLLPPPEGTNG